jgi:phospholipase C
VSARQVRFVNRSLAIAAAAFLLCACKGIGGFAPSAPPAANVQPGRLPIQPHSHASKIKYIVIIIQENRSFNNLFYGYPGAKTASYGYDSKGDKIELQPVGLATKWDLQHNGQGYLRACNGTGKIPGTDCRMDGFDKENWTCRPPGSGPRCPDKYPPYSFVPHSETQPYFDMAHQYVLADEMFASDFDISSFVSHQYIIAALNPDSSVDYPDTDWGCTGGKPDTIAILGKDRKWPDGFEHPCWDPKTLGDELDAAGVSWAYYATLVTANGGKNCGGKADADLPSDGRTGIWSAYQAIKHICYGADWNKDVISPQTQFFDDVKDGNLRAVSWVTPTYANSDHGGSGSKTGPSWVAALVNRIGESKYWNSAAIFIFWDDPGGWYDPQPPAYLDNDGLGMRLPLLIISPYAKKGVVSHVHYEHGSILKFVEDQFGLGRLAASDTRANSPQEDCFDFAQAPRPFVRIKATRDETFFEHQPSDERSPDSD